MSEHDLTFDAMGSHVRLLIGEPGPGMAPAAEAAEQGRQPQSVDDPRPLEMGVALAHRVAR